MINTLVTVLLFVMVSATRPAQTELYRHSECDGLGFVPGAEPPFSLTLPLYEVGPYVTDHRIAPTVWDPRARVHNEDLCNYYDCFSEVVLISMFPIKPGTSLNPEFCNSTVETCDTGYGTQFRSNMTHSRRSPTLYNTQNCFLRRWYDTTPYQWNRRTPRAAEMSVTDNRTCWTLRDPTQMMTSCSVMKTGKILFSPAFDGMCMVCQDFNQLVTSGDALLTAYSSSVTIWQTSVWSSGYRYCDILSGFICCDKGSWTCSYFYSPYWWTVFALIIFAIVCWTCPAVWIFTVAALAFVAKMIAWLLHSPFSVCKRKPASLMLIACGVFACESGLFVPATFTNCFQSYVDGVYTEECTMEYSVEISLASLGSTVCFTVKDENDVIWQEGTISYTSLLIGTYLGETYYTSDWKAYEANRHHCNSVEPCTGNTCEEVDPNDATCEGLFDDQIVSQWPGISRCIRSCGGSHCQGCFYKDASCIFTRLALAPVNATAFSVRRPIGTYYVPSISISTNGNQPIEITQEHFVVSNGLTVDILGTFTPLVVNFGDLKVMNVVGGNRAWLLDAANVNDPTWGKVGDIQSNSQTFITSGGTDAFIADFESISYTTDEDSAHYLVPESGITHLRNELPMDYSGVHWGFDPVTGLAGYSTYSGPLLMSISSTEPFQISRVVASVCPEVKQYNYTGCLGGDTPISILVDIKSTCFEGAIAVSGPNVITNALSITTEVETYTVYVQSISTNIEVHFVGNTEDVIEFKADLIECQNIDSTSYASVSEEHAPDDSSWDFIGHWFPSLPHWLSVTLDIITIIIGAVLLALVVGLLCYGLFLIYPFVVSCMMCCRSKPKQPKRRYEIIRSTK